MPKTAETVEETCRDADYYAALKPTGTILTLLLYVKCGKKSCSCHNGGKLHGPYWYAQWRGQDGKLHKRYIGKTWSNAKIKDLLT